MAAIKFSKQYIEPNPNEIDYWVDLSSNQYGGRMKYYNGFEWVDLVNPDGTHIDINDFYNKLQINQMLSQKASVDSVESKVDDDEVSDVIKNISFSQRGEDGVEMVMFKYDDTTVGIQLPIADNTKSGIITKDTFKNLVNQTQLQQLYSEMYTKLSEIRNNYQPKLRAGANIKIENNVISAVSKIGTDWNDIANKPDIYDKSQVDTMMSGVYKIKGSRRFEAIPLYGNTVGDTYNITNDFSLHGEDYPLGTNVVWTENGWDALAGIFDTSELEGDIQEVKDNYLPLTGGTINGTTSLYKDSATPLTITTNQSNASIAFKNKDMSAYAYLTYGPTGFAVTDAGWRSQYKIWHEGNDGHESGLDADTLDGRQGKYYAYAENTFEWDFNNTSGLPFFIGGYLDKGINTPYPCGAFMHVGTTNRFMQFVSGENALMFRSTINGIKSDWKTIAFTDSNVASATKLATPVKLWGNDFDGSSDTNGGIVVNQNGYISTSSADVFTDTSGIKRPWYGLSFNNTTDNERVMLASYFGMTFKTYSTRSFIFNGGNVGIGTNNPIHKLDVDGNIGVSFEKGVFFKNKENTQQWSIKSSYSSNENLLFVRNESATYNALTITESGKIGIGTNIPNTKLHVAEGNVLIQQKSSPVICKLQRDDRAISLQIDTYKGLYDHNSSKWLVYSNNTGDETYIWGKKLILCSRESYTNGIILNSSGNVTIGSSDRNSGYKLDIDGTACIRGGLEISNATPYIDFHYNNQGSIDYTSRIGEVAAGKLKCYGSWDVTNNVGVANELYVGNQITSGDLVDWYGVSWSENSSDPTCTRIGNMALHRSLPIQSAMKGYTISTIHADFADGIIPLNDDWNTAMYGLARNEASTTVAAIGHYANIMVKIPEFWYIDDYEPSTKTHNLKISQTAKAGWCHHKEAYVGAYEGYDDGTLDRSTKGVIPTVSVTRETIRTKARANGYADEYKWNIYTYEEHRAICHLFLVEYATRNSQAPVNTALTADGFKQGGLGSGCTTGTVTVNGVMTYSFIPTGTTDSLGNGSGQVAYTVTQTDADGNEIGTVTRYANRYRGIENPFGHIWKHVDDVVNVYNAETTYKTVYKCNKPEHFATNKNAKYKPLCSFPGGSKMQGWSKEIKATINCDFFKYSVGGSESTYWCDYNYDNDDTSEHCLLIGGFSGNGGGAGLFYFSLPYGVGHSFVSIGSRLTYLPWAE